jgi:hypothetical protein
VLGKRLRGVPHHPKDSLSSNKEISGREQGGPRANPAALPSCHPSMRGAKKKKAEA